MGHVIELSYYQVSYFVGVRLSFISSQLIFILFDFSKRDEFFYSLPKIQSKPPGPKAKSQETLMRCTPALVICYSTSSRFGYMPSSKVAKVASLRFFCGVHGGLH